MPRRTAEAEDERAVDERKRKANIRLALILGGVALGFYLLMLFYRPR